MRFFSSSSYHLQALSLKLNNEYTVSLELENSDSFLLCIVFYPTFFPFSHSICLVYFKRKEARSMINRTQIFEMLIRDPQKLLADH